MDNLDFSFPAREHLKSKKEFDLLFQSGKRVLKHPILAIWKEEQLEEGHPPVKIGFSVPKKHYKTAVERNQIKRWLRESYRTQKQILNSVVEPNGKSLTVLFITLKTDNKTYEAFQLKMMLLLQSIAQEIAHVD